MKRFIILTAILGAAHPLGAHQGTVNLFVAPSTNQLFALETFAPGQFILFGDVQLSAAGPGFGVTLPTNNVAPGASLELEIVQDLHYWDGFGLGSSDVTIQFEAPQWDNEGNANSSPVLAYTVSQSSGVLAGMLWGNYTGNEFWDSHTTFFLDDLAAPAGVYGMAVKIDSDVHLKTDTFLVPFIYDPNFQWTPGQEDDAIALLRTAMVAHEIADLNADGHVDVIDIDALVAESAAGTNSPSFDLTGDGLVNLSDIDAWLTQAGTAKTPTAEPFLFGDANLDGTVDGQDFLAWNNHKFTGTAAWSAGDFNANGIVDGGDFLVWNDNKFMSVDVGLSRVPEPICQIFPALIAFVLLLRVRVHPG